MTGLALDTLMPTAQGEASVLVVIELGGLPPGIGVTVTAEGTEQAFVGIVLAMTCDAFAGRAGEFPVRMTIAALCGSMPIVQREASARMIERHVLPILLPVALFALVAEAALVCVMGAMAA